MTEEEINSELLFKYLNREIHTRQKNRRIQKLNYFLVSYIYINSFIFLSCMNCRIYIFE